MSSLSVLSAAVELPPAHFSPGLSSLSPQLDDSQFHIAPFHSFTRIFVSSHSIVFRAYRPATQPSSFPTPPSSTSSLNASSPSASNSSSSSAYIGVAADTPFALKFLIHQRDGVLKPVSRTQLSLFSQQYELLCVLRDKGVQGVIRPFELIGVQLPLGPLSAGPPSLSSYAGSTLAVSASASNASASVATTLSPSLCLVTEYFAGRALSTYYSKPRYAAGFPLLEFFPIALSLLSTVASIHAAHIVHKDLTHNNVLYDADTMTTRIIDFGLSEIQLVDADKASAANGGGGSFQGTLAFVSPEQTGRVNRGVDYRSDLYSLGAVMYQMLTGKLPFVSEERDELELVHAIITKTPVAPISHRSTLPPMLSAVVMKLLAKNADDRYQSTRGAEQDLQTVWHQLTLSRPGLATITPLITSRHSTPLQLSMPTTPTPITPTPPSPHSAHNGSSGEVRLLPGGAAQQEGYGSEGDSGRLDLAAANGHVRSMSVSAPSGSTALAYAILPNVASPYLAVRTLSSHSNASSAASTTSSTTHTPILPGRHLPLTTHYNSHQQLKSHSPLPPTDDELALTTVRFPAFPLGRGDIPSRIQIPNKLYGREEELVKMRRAFDTVVRTSESVVFCVDGVAGAGKSSSIRQVCHSISAAYPHCLVVSSKLDQYNRQPFGMFKQLVSEMVLDILTQPTRSLARWRASVLTAVGSSGRLMIEIFPSLQQLIGEQPPVPVLPPAEAQQRLQLVFTAFLCCFCPLSSAVGYVL